MYYVRLKENHKVTWEEADQIIELELSTPECRWPFSDDGEGPELIEVYKTGSKEECEEFISTLKPELRQLFEVEPKLA